MLDHITGHKNIIQKVAIFVMTMIKEWEMWWEVISRFKHKPRDSKGYHLM